MDKMREEFEAWYSGYEGDDEFNYFARCPYDNEQYDIIGTHDAWNAWQASRTALRVELPIQYQAPLVDEPAMDADEVRWALEESGVSYK